MGRDPGCGLRRKTAPALFFRNDDEERICDAICGRRAEIRDGKQRRHFSRRRDRIKMTDSRIFYEQAGIDPRIYALGERAERALRERFDDADRVAEYNQLKVINAFRNARVGEACLYDSTGYGYNDVGRDTLEKVYAGIFHTEAALVRPQITCGTHAINIALSANLRPGDRLLSPVGKPYDTLEEVIGIRPSRGSLKEYGIEYDQADWAPGGRVDYDAIRSKITPRTKMCTIQRSKGYDSRPTLSVAQIGELIAFIRSVKSDIICMVDNCYGEFVETLEPTDAGADLVAGSLIKNPGGGLAPFGGYIAGRKDLIEQCAFRLTSPGLGKEVGASSGTNRPFYQGLFLAPCVTASALKGALFAARIYEDLGFPVNPRPGENRYDIIQSVETGSAEALIAFCRGIQAAAPVDSFVEPEPWDMPGYEDPVIMAAGTFVSGASIELTADGPLRPPYNVYFQGGLTWPHAKFGVLMSVQKLLDAGALPVLSESRGSSFHVTGEPVKSERSKMHE